METQRSPEWRMWCAVIERAFRDAVGGSGEGSGEARSACTEARLWFVTGDDDFRWTCEAAGLDPTLVRRHALKLMAVGLGREPGDGDHRPAEIGRASCRERVCQYV